MILVVQCSTVYQQHIRESLDAQLCKVVCVGSYEEAQLALTQQQFQLVLLDVDLGQRSGFELCRAIRVTKTPPVVIFVATVSCTADRVLGFELGADDFISYPCHARELQARVNVHLRHSANKFGDRATNNACSATTLCGCLSIDDIRHEVTIQGQPVYLTATEYTLLRHLASHPNQVFTRTQLLDAVWGYQHSGYEHTVNSHINRLRAKLPAYAAKSIKTLWGVGYKMVEVDTPQCRLIASSPAPAMQVHHVHREGQRNVEASSPVSAKIR